MLAIDNKETIFFYKLNKYNFNSMKNNMFLSRTYSGDLAPKSTRFVYSFVSTFRDALLQFVSLFLLLYIQFASPLGNESLENYETMYLIITIGLVFIKVLSGLLAPITSYLIDISILKMGKFRPFVLFGALISIIFYFLMFFTPGSGYLFVSLFLIFVLLQEITYQLNDIAFWGYLPTMTSDETKRANILSIMNTFIAIGSYTVCAISPILTTGDAKKNLTIVAIIIGVLYLLSQVIFTLFFMKEKEGINVKKEGLKIKDSYTPLFKDKQVLLIMICFLLMFASQFIIIGNSANYFYYNYGYGSFDSIPLEGASLSGGVMSFIFSLIFGAGSLLAMFTFQFIIRKFKKKHVLFFAMCLVIIGYLYMFFFGFNKGYEVSLFIVSFFAFFGQGLIYMIFSLNCTNVVEYHEYYYKSRNDSSIASYKFMGVKIANGLQTLILYFSLFFANLMPLNSSISNIESRFNIGDIDLATKNELILNAITTYTNLSSYLFIYRIGFVLVPLILLVLTSLLTITRVKIMNEEFDKKIKLELMNIKNSD